MGGGHVAQSLAPMAVAAGFSLTVLDDRPGFLNPARFPREAQLQSGDFSRRSAHSTSTTQPTWPS